MKTVSTPKAPTPAGHYSQGIVHNGLVYVAGQLPIDPATGEIVSSDIERQAEQTLRNVEAILDAGGSSLGRVLSMTVYIQGRSLWPAVNAVVARVMGDHKPARAMIPVPEIKPGCMIEIQAIGAAAE